MSIYKPGRPNKYDPSTGEAPNRLPVPVNTDCGTTLASSATSVKPAI